MSDPNRPRYRTDQSARVLSALLGCALLLTSACTLLGDAAGGMDHRDVTVPGAASGPVFDRASMTRTYRTTEEGGVEQVIARDPADQAQLSRVRAYLREEAEQFRQGRYGDPAKAHGMEMPGSKELEAGYARVEVVYVDLTDGGQLTYLTTDEALVQLIHSWFQRRQMGGA